MTERGNEVLAALGALAQAEQVEVISKLLEQPRRRDIDVSVTPLREHFLIRHCENGLTAEQVALSCEWVYGKSGRGGKPRGDYTRVLRALGLVAQQSRHAGARHTVARYTSYDRAVLLAQAIDVDYHEVGV